MITGKQVNEFAMRVESLCDFFLEQIDLKDGSEDIVALQKIKEEAADLQFQTLKQNGQYTIAGLADYVSNGG